MNNEYICRVTQKIVDKCQIQLSLFHNISIHEMKSNWIEPPTYFEAIYISLCITSDSHPSNYMLWSTLSVVSIY